MENIKYIVIGGSAGSFKVIVSFLEAMPKDFPHSIILVLHRLKHVKSGFVEALSAKSQLLITEPFDKETIKKNRVYIAPANYHLYIEADKSFSLSTEEQLNYSRPSIDLTLSSAGLSLKKELLGIILSGANRDGANGLKKIKENGGFTVVQSIDDAVVVTMPEAAIKLTNPHKILTAQEIIDFVIKLKPE